MSTTRQLQTEIGDGCFSFWAKVSAGARKNELRSISDGKLKIAVTQVAEKGKANSAVVELLAKRLQIAKSQISIVAGSSVPQKKISVSTSDPARIVERLRQIMRPSDR